MNRSIVLLALTLGLATARAETAYVSDQLEVPVRSGTSTRYKILRMVPSGTPLEQVRQDSENGYTLVRTPEGTQGWILSRYLMDTPSARERLTAAEEAVEPLSRENAELRERLAALSGEKAQVQSEYAELEEGNQRVRQELAQIRKAAANAIAIDNQNKALQERVVNLERELQLVQQENQALSDRSARDWFLMGAGVLLLGVAMGLILPRMRWQKRTRWGDL